MIWFVEELVLELMMEENKPPWKMEEKKRPWEEVRTHGWRWWWREDGGSDETTGCGANFTYGIIINIIYIEFHLYFICT